MSSTTQFNITETMLGFSPSEFEHLVAKLFECLGFAVQVTQQSRDGGVDCLVYDYAPLRGVGKAVVQVKKYRDVPVGEPAVRDLYGVVHHEHASKGILVTTSSFTADAIAFAANKPIELIDGIRLSELVSSTGLIDTIQPNQQAVPSDLKSTLLSNLVRLSFECSRDGYVEDAIRFAEQAHEIYASGNYETAEKEVLSDIYFALAKGYHLAKNPEVAKSFYSRAVSARGGVLDKHLITIFLDWCCLGDHLSLSLAEQSRALIAELASDDRLLALRAVITLITATIWHFASPNLEQEAWSFLHSSFDCLLSPSPALMIQAPPCALVYLGRLNNDEACRIIELVFELDDLFLELSPVIPEAALTRMRLAMVESLSCVSERFKDTLRLGHLSATASQRAGVHSQALYGYLPPVGTYKDKSRPCFLINDRVQRP